MNRNTLAGETGTPSTLAPITVGLSLVLLLSGCGAGTPTSAAPTAPTPTIPTPTAAVTYTLSGVVFELNGDESNPLEGVDVYCDSCGSSVGHTSVLTDANGSYSLAWAANGVHPLFVTKAGYGYPAGTPLDNLGRIHATVNGDTRFDVQLVRR